MPAIGPLGNSGEMQLTKILFFQQPVGAYRGGGRVSITLILGIPANDDDDYDGGGCEQDMIISATAARSMEAFAQDSRRLYNYGVIDNTSNL